MLVSLYAVATLRKSRGCLGDRGVGVSAAASARVAFNVWLVVRSVSGFIVVAKSIAIVRFLVLLWLHWFLFGGVGSDLDDHVMVVCLAILVTLSLVVAYSYTIFLVVFSKHSFLHSLREVLWPFTFVFLFVLVVVIFVCLVCLVRLARLVSFST